jgi:enabled protein
MDMGSLAAQLQQAKLKRTNAPPQPANENSGNSTSSSGSGGAGNYGTIGRTSGGEMASMMDEMAKTLARRRERQKDAVSALANKIC